MGSDEEILDNTLISKARLEALVDGVFAFAMTLLVVSLNVPTIPKAEAATELPAYLVTMFPQFLSFLIAFFILASLWIVHHEHFHFLRSVNKVVLWLNILILIFVVPGAIFNQSLRGIFSCPDRSPHLPCKYADPQLPFLSPVAVHHPPTSTPYRAGAP